MCENMFDDNEEEKENVFSNSKEKEEAIFNIYDIDKLTIQNIEMKKNDLLLNFFDLDDKTRIRAMLDLIFTMKTLISKYNENYLDDEKVKINDENLSFLDLEKKFLFENFSITFQYVYFEKIIYLYNKFLKEYLNVKLPTEKIDYKKKLTDAIFSIVNNYDYDAIIQNYENLNTKLNLSDSKLNFLSYILSIISNYDLSYKIVINGFERIGKSTLALQLFYRIYQYREKNIYNELFHMLSNIKFDIDKTLDLNEKDIYIFDEASLISDKRLSMMLKQINLIKTFRINAYKNNIIFLLSQDFSELDNRIVNSSNMLIHIYKRGYAFVYAFKQNITNSKIEFVKEFKEISKEKYEKMQIEKLKRLQNFIFTFQFSDINPNETILWEFKKAYEIEKRDHIKEVTKKLYLE